MNAGRSTGPLLFGPLGKTAAWIVVALLLLGWAALAAWQYTRAPQMHHFDGFAMGSMWSVQVVGLRRLDVVAIRTGIEAQLVELDRQLSGYRDTGELSQLNNTPIGEWRPLPNHLRAVIEFGRQLHDDSSGAFDLTIKPLVNLWGFGAAEPRIELPGEVEIAAARARLGNDSIELSADGSKIRRVADVTIDVDAIAHGYAADVIAGWLDEQGLRDHLVEVGGELRGAGRRPDGSAWRFGIERPILARGEVEQVILVSDQAIATSGDYRDFFEIAGQRYSQTLDPATGRPVAHDLVSVTVAAPTGLGAAGCATTMLVLGADRGMAWANARALAVYMVLRDAKGTLHEQYNAAFAPLLVAK